MQKQSKSSRACERCSESSSNTLFASHPNCAPCVSTAVNKDEKDVSRSPSETDKSSTDKTVTDKTLTP